MSEFDEKLNALLSNPDSMAQIMQLAQTLSGQGGKQPESPGASGPKPPEGASHDAAPEPNGAGRPASGPQPSAQSAGADLLSSLTGGLDPKLLSRLIPLLQELNSEKDSNAARLLYALRPYLKPERQERIERALQLSRLIHIGKNFLSGWEG